MPYTDKMIKRFWDAIIPCMHGMMCEVCCWLWQNPGMYGYGVLTMYDVQKKGSRTLHAHRMAWEIAHGQDIPDGLWCLHRCNVRACCNPAHLYIGTPQDNTRDMMVAGHHVSVVAPERIPRGDTHWRRIDRAANQRYIETRRAGKYWKLTQADVAAIRRLHAVGSSPQMLAKEFGVSDGHLRKIIKGQIWKPTDLSCSNT